MPGSGDERAWVRGAQAGSASDLEALFRSHWPRAYRAAYLVVHDNAAAEDLKRSSFRQNRICRKVVSFCLRQLLPRWAAFVVSPLVAAALTLGRGVN